jgi:hypothetical protein
MDGPYASKLTCHAEWNQPPGEGVDLDGAAQESPSWWGVPALLFVEALRTQRSFGQQRCIAMMTGQLKSLDELVHRRGALRTIKKLVEEADGRVEMLPGDPQSGASTLLALQVSTRTPLGALAYHTGGLLVDHGWLRILGNGHPRLLWGLTEWNGLAVEGVMVPDKLLIAHDVLGGFFAIENNRKVSYFSPDTLKWENTQLGHGDWLTWALSEDLADFYEDLRWPNWKREVKKLDGQTGLSIQPYLFKPGPPLKQRERKPVPIRELWGLYQELAQQL